MFAPRRFACCWPIRRPPLWPRPPLPITLIVTQSGTGDRPRGVHPPLGPRPRSCRARPSSRDRPVSGHRPTTRLAATARADAGFATRQVPARRRERRRHHRHPGRGLGRAADRADRGEGLRVRPRAARRTRTWSCSTTRSTRSIAPVADLATPAGSALTAIFPRTGKRATFTARRESGAAGGTAGG